MKLLLVFGVIVTLALGQNFEDTFYERCINGDAFCFASPDDCLDSYPETKPCSLAVSYEILSDGTYDFELLASDPALAMSGSSYVGLAFSEGDMIMHDDFVLMCDAQNGLTVRWTIAVSEHNRYPRPISVDQWQNDIALVDLQTGPQQVYCKVNRQPGEFIYLLSNPPDYEVTTQLPGDYYILMAAGVLRPEDNVPLFHNITAASTVPEDFDGNPDTTAATSDPAGTTSVPPDPPGSTMRLF